MATMKKIPALKYVLVGDSGVGKTSLLIRYTQGKFQTDCLSTMGVDFKSKTISVFKDQLNDQEEKKVTLNIWDTAGQERFQTITRSFYRGAHAIILLFSLADRESFNNLTKWIDRVMEDVNLDAEQRTIYLVGSKSDCNQNRFLSDITDKNIKISTQQETKIIPKHFSFEKKLQRLISRHEAEIIADKHGIKYMEVSSKTNFNVSELFQCITHQILIHKTRRKSMKDEQKIVLPKRFREKKKENCC